MMLRLLDVCLAIAAIPAVAAATYLAVLTLFSQRQPLRAPTSRAQLPFFDVVIPAHDEEAQVARAVQSVLGVDYPRGRFRVLVVADNCSDATATHALRAGAFVLRREDAVRRGKGHALAFAFDRILADGRADAVVIVDADTRVSPLLLRAFAARLQAGAVAMQGDYRVRNPAASWRTRLMVVALATFHGLRSIARERLGLSCGLRGNGMALSSSVLREVPYDAFSVVEDVEHGIHLAEAGHRVAYVPEAIVWGEMATSGSAAESQRNRWEAGRKMLAQLHAWRLIRRGVATRSKVVIDLGVDLAVPPLARLVMWISVGLGASILLASVSHDALALSGWALAAALVTAYVVRGAQLSEVGARALFDLAWAPVYMAWKLGVPRHIPASWIRTTRENLR
jgi:cellulose synthase/poly-beta-1,6-N-acetylglucosamine synthase-like glycosyltransferase